MGACTSKSKRKREKKGWVQGASNFHLKIVQNQSVDGCLKKRENKNGRWLFYKAHQTE
jgi:hypothetical protein